MAVEITNKNLNELLSQKDVVVVDFWAPWCGPCKTLGPIIESVNNENGDDNVIIGKLNVDDETDLAIKYGIRNIPTVLFFKDGEIVDKFIGIKSKDEIESVIAKIK